MDHPVVNYSKLLSWYKIVVRSKEVRLQTFVHTSNDRGYKGMGRKIDKRFN